MIIDGEEKTTTTQQSFSDWFQGLAARVPALVKTRLVVTKLLCQKRCENDFIVAYRRQIWRQITGMEAETTASVSETPMAGSSENIRSNSEDFGLTLRRCGLCKENVHNRRPKLLACLHTFCQQCVSSLETGESKLYVQRIAV